MRRRLLVFTVSCLLLVPPPPALGGETPTWWERKRAAVRFVETRSGIESFAFVDEQGRLWGYHPWRVVRSASLLKPMLMVAYLNLSSVRVRPLRERDRDLLAPMIRWSDNRTAERVLELLGPRPLYRLAERARMKHFQLRTRWGWTEITAGDQARFFLRFDRYVPARHRPYARWLLSHIVASQRWGIPPEVPAGWTVYFKGGWSTGTGEVTHQVAMLRRNTTRIALAVLTKWNPSHAYGTRTIRGVARRILRAPLPFEAG
ncbi:MAG: serine hydrolase [Gaiellaceae bacterium]